MTAPVFSVPDSALAALSESSRACIQRLFTHEPESSNVCVFQPFLLSGRETGINDCVSTPNVIRAPRHEDLPISKLAAVLVLLYERAGGLRVLLTTRSKELRSQSGQTALPGGKVDEADAGVVETAVSLSLFPCLLLVPLWDRAGPLTTSRHFGQFREADEEVAFSLRSPHVHTLCTLDPFVSRNDLVVTPVVALLDDVSVLEGLRAAPGEVSHIFDHPLEALLDPKLARSEALVPLGSEDWPYEAELHVRSLCP